MLPPPPPQLINPITGFPVWRGPYPGWNEQQREAVILVSLMGLLLGMILALRYKAKNTYATIQDLFSNTTAIFTEILTYYIVGTFTVVAWFIVTDVGKLWVPLGIFHNTAELAILLCFWYAKHPAGWKHFFGILGLYWGLNQAIVLLAPWPVDALYFKFQGLIFDFALVIQFYRLHLANKGVRLDDDDYAPPALPARTSNGTIPAPATSYSPTTNDTWILVGAAAVHLIGNTITVTTLAMGPFFWFQFSYGVTFLMYGYYIARNPGTTPIRFVATSFGKEAVVIGVCTVLALATSLVGIKVGMDYYGPGMPGDPNGGHGL